MFGSMGWVDGIKSPLPFQTIFKMAGAHQLKYIKNAHI